MIRYVLIGLFFFQCLFAEEYENSKQKLRFFNIDMHISVIADIKNILNSLGHEVVDWSLSGHTWVFGRERAKIDVINENNWTDLSQEKCDRFYERYKDELEQYDGFIVTYPPAFAKLYERFNKPIIIVIPIRYEMPYYPSPEAWKEFDEYLRKGVANNKIFLIANNRGDQIYLKHYTDLDARWIPSLCLYTKGEFSGKLDKFAIHSLGYNWSAHMSSRKIQSPPWGYQWQELYDRRGIIHFPYVNSVMSLFEQYSANMPLFFPSKSFLKKLYEEDREHIFRYLVNTPYSIKLGDLNNLNDSQVLDFWINISDFYNEEDMPYIQYFESFSHLEDLLETVDCFEVSRKMKEHNKIRKAKIFKEWNKLLDEVILSGR
jgi:hypothetical protein